MSFLLRMLGKLPGEVNDPVLGRLAHRDGQWTGVLQWEHSPIPFALAVHRAGELPAPFDRAVFQELSGNYLALRPAIDAALAHLWKSMPKPGQDAQPPAASEPWAALMLQGMSLHPDGHAELIYGLEESTEMDAAFVISVDGLDVTPLEYME